MWSILGQCCACDSELLFGDVVFGGPFEEEAIEKFFEVLHTWKSNEVS